MRSANRRTARAENRSFAVAPDPADQEIRLGVPLTAQPGDYNVSLSFVNDQGEERSASILLTVRPFARPAASTVPPVVLLNGWQFPSITSSCPIPADSSNTFGSLQAYLLGSPNSVPAVYFFDNCSECPNCPIEELGNDLGNFLNSLAVPEVDVVAHSMGGLIVRSYLSGKQQGLGIFNPPLATGIRKAVFIAAPNFGSYLADSPLAQLVLGKNAQTSEMERASEFVWDLATWNQFADDLRGVDAVGVIGNAGSYQNMSNDSDGVVGLTSASLDFAEPGRTRIVPYCHIDSGSNALIAAFIQCSGTGIAHVDSPTHQTYQIISSFLMDTTAWQSIGSAPAQDQYLSKYGGLLAAEVNAPNEYVPAASVTWNGVNLTAGPSPYFFYADFVNGTRTFSFDGSTCGPFTEPVGFYSAVRCKFGPRITSVGPLLAGSGKTVQAGGMITIQGSGFGSQCGACTVTISNGLTSTSTTIANWTDTSIQTTLPSGFAGGAMIGVTASSGFDSINIVAAPASDSAISLSPSAVDFAYTTGGAAPPAQTVLVMNTGSSSLSVSSNEPWLTASVSKNLISISVNPASLGANTYQGAITVSAAVAANSPLSIPVTLAVTAPASGLTISGVRNSASGSQGAVAPGELISIYGTGLGPDTGVQFSNPATGLINTSLGGTMVLFGSTPAPILYASSTQVNAVVPYEVAGRSQVVMQVQFQGASISQTLQVAGASPGIYTLDESGSGQAAAINQDGTINGSSHPAAKGSYVSIYFTGLGRTDPPGVTGSVNGLNLKYSAQPVTAAVGGKPAMVTFAGAAPTLVDGANQLNLQLAPDTPSGSQPVVITVGGIASAASASVSVQ